jgi:hypothetical protein
MPVAKNTGGGVPGAEVALCVDALGGRDGECREEDGVDRMNIEIWRSSDDYRLRWVSSASLIILRAIAALVVCCSFACLSSSAMACFGILIVIAGSLSVRGRPTRVAAPPARTANMLLSS